ncbi:MAG: hypothetical protein SPH18_07910 [Sutterella parvirubra]|nr:hypothetical protein [Sutterella parvirubra]
MKISELIEALDKIKDEHDDIEVMFESISYWSHDLDPIDAYIHDVEVVEDDPMHEGREKQKYVRIS